MGLFNKKPKVVKEIRDAAWGYMVSVHHVDVDTLSREMRCVERAGTIAGNRPVTFLRIFRISDVEKAGISVEGWETFDQHPELILYEGYLTPDNRAQIEQRTKTS